MCSSDLGRIKGFASGILSTGANLFGELFFGSTVYADEIDGVSDAMEENITITERLGRGVDNLGQKLMDSAAKFKMNAEAIVHSKSPIKALGTAFETLGSKVSGFFNKYVSGGWKNLISAFKSLPLAIGDAFQTASGWIKDFFSSLDFSSKAEFIK